MNFKDLQWNVPSIHGLYVLKIQDIDKGYRFTKGFWNGSGFLLIDDELNVQEFVEYFHYCGVTKNLKRSPQLPIDQPITKLILC